MGRVSVDRDDAGHAAWLKVRGKCHVELDGLPVTKVITADPVEGTLVRYVTDSDDRPVLNEERKEILRETLTGNVTVYVDDGAEHG